MEDVFSDGKIIIKAYKESCKYPQKTSDISIFSSVKVLEK